MRLTTQISHLTRFILDVLGSALSLSLSASLRDPDSLGSQLHFTGQLHNKLLSSGSKQCNNVKSQDDELIALEWSSGYLANMSFSPITIRM